MEANTCLRGIFLDKTDLRNINLSGADLSGADLSSANLSHSDLSRANLSGARMSEVILIEVDLSGANLSGADLTYSGIMQSNLTEAILDGSKIGGEGSFIRDSCLNRVSFRGATFSGITIRNTTMRKAILNGSNFRIEEGLSDIDLTGASLKGCDFNFSNYIPPGAGRIILPDGRLVGGASHSNSFSGDDG